MTRVDESVDPEDMSRHKLREGNLPPVHWPSLTTEEMREEEPALAIWTASLVERFPHSIRLPPCWAEHSDIVETLSALRDYERYAFSGVLGSGGAIDWLRAMRDAEQLLDASIRKLRCAIGTDSAHAAPPRSSLAR